MRDGIESLGRVRAQGILLLVVAFVAGAFAGVALDRVLLARRGPPPFGPGGPGPMGSGVFGRGMPGPRGGLPPSLAGLDLTPDQRSRITAIIERSRPRTDSLLRQTWPRVRALMDSVQLQIRQVLTPAQREQFDAINERMRRYDRNAPPPPAVPPAG